VKRCLKLLRDLAGILYIAEKMGKNMKIRILSLIAASLLFAGCAELLTVIQNTSAIPLTEEEVVAGLKEALVTGARNSAEKLARENGYYSDLAVRIPLPDEAKVIVDNISRIPGGEELIGDVILRINRAAEDAAREVAPIFVSSITQMTLKDAFGILKGSDNAATMYLRNTTYNQLYDLYLPKIRTSTEKDIIGGISTSDSWLALTGKWNTFAASVPGRLAGFKTVNTDLDDFLTRKALDGIFLKVAEEELKIRKDVSARVTPLLKRVFGTLDNPLTL
jgi:hypothetical protein